MMKKLLILFLVFSFFMCYSQDKDIEYQRKSTLLGLVNSISWGLGVTSIEKKGEYMLSAPFSEVTFGRDILLHSSDKVEGAHIILSTGISFFNISGNYYDGGAKYVKNTFAQIPMMLSFEIDGGYIAMKASLGFYASALTYSIVRGEKLEKISEEDYPGYNFGIYAVPFSVSYQIGGARGFKLALHYRNDFTQAYYKGSKVIINEMVAITLGYE